MRLADATFVFRVSRQPADTFFPRSERCLFIHKKCALNWFTTVVLRRPFCFFFGISFTHLFFSVLFIEVDVSLNKMVHGTCYFSEKWFIDPRFKDWIEKVKDDNTKFHCKWCNSSIFCKNGGVRNVIEHTTSVTHKKCQNLHMTNSRLTGFKMFKKTNLKSTEQKKGKFLINVIYMYILLFKQ